MIIISREKGSLGEREEALGNGGEGARKGGMERGRERGKGGRREG